MPSGVRALAAVPGEPIPLSVLTGFLGSGKTTFLGRVLASPGLADPAAGVSELGAVARDGIRGSRQSPQRVSLLCRPPGPRGHALPAGRSPPRQWTSAVPAHCT